MPLNSIIDSAIEFISSFQKKPKPAMVEQLPCFMQEEAVITYAINNLGIFNVYGKANECLEDKILQLG